MAIAHIIGTIAESILEVTKISREAIAAKLEETAAKVRAGELIPDEALAQARKDKNRLDGIRKKLGA